MKHSTHKPNTSFWIIGIVALVWNLMGVFQYISQAYMTNETLAALSEAERALYENVPAWVTAVFAIAVFGGALGCLLLLLRKKMATTVFIISFIAILVQTTYNLFMSRASEVYGPGGLIMPIIILIIGLFLIWYSKKSSSNRWLS